MYSYLLKYGEQRMQQVNHFTFHLVAVIGTLTYNKYRRCILIKYHSYEAYKRLEKPTIRARIVDVPSATIRAHLGTSSPV